MVATIAMGAGLTAIACGMPTTTATKTSAPTNSLTAPTASFSATPPAPTTPAVRAVPVDASGSGDSVTTVNLEVAGYTIQYTNSTGYMIVKPVQSDGSTGTTIINATDPSGVTSYKSTGPVTLQVQNAGEWTLHFVPLS